MSALPPQLAELDRQYNQLLDDVEAGHTSQADALAVLSGLGVHDGAGAIWALNPEGDFVRAAYAGAPAQVTDPAHFAPPAGAAAPSSFPAPPGPTGLPFPLPTSPAATPADPFTTAPGAMGYSQQAPVGFDTFAPAEQAPAKAARRKVRTPKTPQLGSSVHGGDASASGTLGTIVRFLSANRVLAAIVVAGVVLLVLLTHTGGSSAPSTTLPTATASVSADPMPTSGAPAGAGLPSVAQGDAAVNALESGKPDLVAGSASTATDPATLARVTALWAGAKQLGYKVTVGPAATDQGGAVVQQWGVTAPDGTAVSTVKVTWLKAGDSWKLATVLLF